MSRGCLPIVVLLVGSALAAAGPAPTATPTPAPTATPTPAPKPTAGRQPALVPPQYALRGTAVWYDYRVGHAAAGPLLRRALGAGWRGSTVSVCSGARCIRVVLSDWCACAGGRRLVDLDRRSFAKLADPSRGTLPVVVRW